MAKRKKKVVPDEDIKDVMSDSVEAPKKGAIHKTLGVIVKPLSPDKDKNDMESLKDSSLRSPLEALLIHEYAKHELEEHKDQSPDGLVHAIKDILCGIERQNSGFLRDRHSYDKDLGLISSILKDTLPKGSDLKSLIARALFGKKHYDDEHGSIHGKMKEELPKEVLGLLK